MQAYAPKKRIDRPDCWIFPGLINTHHHLYQWLTRGLAQDALLQHGEAVDAQWFLELAAVLGHDVGKPLDAVGLVRLVLDQETRPRLLEREPRRGAHQHVLAELAVQLGDRPEGIELQRLAEGRGTAHERTERRGARQVVVDAPAAHLV